MDLGLWLLVLRAFGWSALIRVRGVLAEKAMVEGTGHCWFCQGFLEVFNSFQLEDKVGKLISMEKGWNAVV